MTVPVLRGAIKAKLDGLTWTDISSDVLGGFSYVYGIRDNSPSNRIASPGELTFDLNNSIGNSGRLTGYYTPGHVNCRAGFAIGLPVGVFVTYDGVEVEEWEGTIPNDGVRPTPGIYGTRRVTVTVRDWFHQASKHKMVTPTLLQNVGIPETVAAIVANMGINPPGTIEYTGGDETFEYVFDTSMAETTALGEMSKAILAEFGYITLNRSGLYVESRYNRSDNKTTVTKIPVHTDDCDWLATEDGDFLTTEDGDYLAIETTASALTIDAPIDMDVKYGKLINKIKVTAYPRRVDAAATTVLFTLNSSIYLAAGASAVIEGNYKDPTGIATKTAGMDMVTPVAGTHYAMFANSDGTGTDLTANLTITPGFGTTGFSHTVTNTGAVGGYITMYEAVGRGIYWDETVSYTLQDDISIETNNVVSDLVLDLKYQNDPVLASSLATVILDQNKDPYMDVNSVTDTANKSTLMASAFVYLKPGDRVRVEEYVSGIAEDFFIHGAKVTCVPGEQSDIFIFTWYLKKATFDMYEYGEWDSGLWDSALWAL